MTAAKSASQTFTLVPRNENDAKDTILLYHYADKRDGLIGADLFIYANGKFTCQSYTDVAYWISAGTWTKTGEDFSFSSNLKNTLPINVSYLPLQTEEHRISKFAIIKDLAGREYPHSAISINQDSVSCYYGDLECFGSYKTIDSIKITINDDVTSTWIKVDPTKGVIQVILQTDIDLDRYFPFNAKFKREDNILKPVNE